jgi:hypothetical protein
MKNLNKMITLILFIGTSYFFQAQSPVTSVNTSSPNSCDGYAFITDSSAFTSWSWLYTDSSAVIQENGILMNLCPGNYGLQVTVNGIVETYAFVIEAGTNSGCSAFYVSIYASNPSAPGNCDGSAVGVTSNGTPPFAYVWQNGETTEQILNQCEGSAVSVTITDAAGCVGTSSYIYSDSLNWNYDLGGYVYSGTTNMDGSCDGTAFVDVWGGQAPYTFIHQDGQTSQEVSGLCAGIYSVFVTDASGDSLLLNYIVSNPSDIYNGGNYTDSIVVDTLTYDIIEDCNIDFLTLDSAFISDLIYLSNDSIQVIWSVIDANGLTNVVQDYAITTGIGVYELFLQIFCPQRSGSDFVYANDRIYFNPSLAKVQEISDEKFNVYPNPVNDVLVIENDGNVQITISDLSGKIVKSISSTNNKTSINTEDLSKGNYFVTISNEKMNLTKMIIK